MWKEDTFDTDIEYAMRMIKTGCATVEQAARTCGIPLPILQAKLKDAANAAKPRVATPEKKTV